MLYMTALDFRGMKSTILAILWSMHCCFRPVSRVGVACMTPELWPPLYNGQTPWSYNGGRFRGVPRYAVCYRIKKHLCLHIDTQQLSHMHTLFCTEIVGKSFSCTTFSTGTMSPTSSNFTNIVLPPL